MRRTPSLILLLSLLPCLSFASELKWRDTTRDVYFDGKLERTTQVLSTEGPSQLAIHSPRLRHAIVLDLDTGEVTRTSRSSFTFSVDRTGATTPAALKRKRSGHFTRTSDGVYVISDGRNDLVVAPHQSSAGPLEKKKFLADFPVWAASMKAYAPDVAAVEVLRTISEPTELRVVFATWCGDSKYLVPRLLAAVDQAANPNLRVELIGIGPDFHSPLDFIEENRIINVPTILVERSGEELGRIVETPAGETPESDLAAIVSGRSPRHQGRWEREARLASGSYEIREGGVATAAEDWEIFHTPSGGLLAHSVISRGEAVREVWHTLDASRQTKFIEITDRSAGAIRRTRFRRDGSSLSVHSRGNLSGIVDQILSLPGDCRFDTSAIVSAGWSCVEAPVGTVSRYAVGKRSSEVLGELESVEVVTSPGSRRSIGGKVMTLDEHLQVPIELTEGVREVKLVRLERGSF